MEKEIVIKAFYKKKGDNRRLIFDRNDFNFKELKKALKKLFKFNAPFTISYCDEEEDCINIKSDTDLMTAVRQSKNKTLKISVKEDSDNLRETIPDKNEELKTKVELLVKEVVTSKPVVDKLLQLIRDEHQSEANLEQEEENITETMNGSSSSFEELPREQEEVQKVEEEEQEVLNNEEDEKVEEEDKSNEEDEKVEEEDKSNEDKMFPQEREEFKNPEPFVFINERNDNRLSLKSLLSIFRISTKTNEIPNFEEMLKQLEEMGFYDREPCIRALRFHHQYNEGLDEVIEDLLLQQKDKKENQTVNVEQ